MTIPLHLVKGAIVERILNDAPLEVIRRVSSAYSAHHRGQTEIPPSLFLRYPGSVSARTIALPAYISADTSIAGMKWISSNPGNHDVGLPRASGVIVLNDTTTGFPICVLEGSRISAARTAASAALAVQLLAVGVGRTLGVIGSGLIAAAICHYLHESNQLPPRLLIYDRDASRAAAFAKNAADRYGVQSEVSDMTTTLDCDLVSLATTASRPHLPSSHEFRPGQLILNISLRDIQPRSIVASNNILDDVEHCLKESTSPHLAEQMTGTRDFITGTIGEALDRPIDFDRGRAVIFSPFGLGVLDVFLAHWIFETAMQEDLAVKIDNFF